MPIFLMFGKYSSEAMKGISSAFRPFEMLLFQMFIWTLLLLRTYCTIPFERMSAMPTSTMT